MTNILLTQKVTPNTLLVFLLCYLRGLSQIYQCLDVYIQMYFIDYLKIFFLIYLKTLVWVMDYLKCVVYF